MSDAPVNPYAPPIPTSGPPVKDDEAWPSRTRVLLPVYLVALFRGLASRLWFRWSFVLTRERFTMEWWGTAYSYSNLGGGVAGTLIGAFTGDRRAARPLVLASLGLLMVGILGTFVASSRAPAVATQIATALGPAVIFLVLTGYALRAVTVRGVYLSMTLLFAASALAGAGASASRLLFEQPVIGIATAAGSCGLALVAAFWLLAPGRRVVDVDGPDQHQHRTGRVVLVIILLGAFGGLFWNWSMLSIPLRAAEGVTDLQQQLAELPRVGWLLVPIIAYLARWRPAYLVVAGIGTTAAGVLVGAFGRLAWPALVSRVLINLGYHVLYEVPSMVLVRRVVPLSRIVFWIGMQYITSQLIRIGSFYLIQLMVGEVKATMLTGTVVAALMLGIGVTLALAVRRLGPLEEVVPELSK